MDRLPLPDVFSFNPNLTIVELATDARKIAFRYRRLCGKSSDTETVDKRLFHPNIHPSAGCKAGGITTSL